MAREQQELAIIVTARDLASKSLKTISGTVKTFSSDLTRFGGAIGRAGSNLKGLITGPLGILGFTGALFGLTGALGTSIQKASDFGRATTDLAAATGLNTQQTSKLVDVLDKYGLSADDQINTLGRLEKNVGGLTQTKEDAVKFEKEYGLSLLDSNGAVADANTLLLRAADYFTNKNIPATEKATVMAKLFGRSWQTLIPILALGSKGLKEETASALELTDAQIAQMAGFRIAQRDFNDAVGDLQTMIGVDFMPDLTSGLKTAMEWINTHRDEIRGWFRGGLDAAKQLAGFIANTVLPTIGSIAGTARGMWGAIPGPLRDLLTKGFLADRTIKFLFGFSPLSAAGGLLGTGFNQFLGRGSSPANPMYVSGIGGAGTGGAGAAGLGLVGAVASAAPAIALAVSSYLADQFNNDPARQQLGIQGTFQPFASPFDVSALINNTGTAVELLQKEIDLIQHPNSTAAQQETNHLLAQIGLDDQRRGERQGAAWDNISRNSNTTIERIEAARLAITRIAAPIVTVVGSTVVNVSAQSVSTAQTVVSTWTGSTKYATAV